VIATRNYTHLLSNRVNYLTAYIQHNIISLLEKRRVCVYTQIPAFLLNNFIIGMDNFKKLFLKIILTGLGNIQTLRQKVRLSFFLEITLFIQEMMALIFQVQLKNMVTNYF